MPQPTLTYVDIVVHAPSDATDIDAAAAALWAWVTAYSRSATALVDRDRRVISVTAQFNRPKTAYATRQYIATALDNADGSRHAATSTTAGLIVDTEKRGGAGAGAGAAGGAAKRARLAAEDDDDVSPALLGDGVESWSAATSVIAASAARLTRAFIVNRDARKRNNRTSVQELAPPSLAASWTPAQLLERMSCAMCGKDAADAACVACGGVATPTPAAAPTAVVTAPINDGDARTTTLFVPPDTADGTTAGTPPLLLAACRRITAAVFPAAAVWRVEPWRAASWTHCFATGTCAYSAQIRVRRVWPVCEEPSPASFEGAVRRGHTIVCSLPHCTTRLVFLAADGLPTAVSVHLGALYIDVPSGDLHADAWIADMMRVMTAADIVAVMQYGAACDGAQVIPSLGVKGMPEPFVNLSRVEDVLVRPLDAARPPTSVVQESYNELLVKWMPLGGGEWLVGTKYA